MTLPRLDALTQYWVENPPVHLSISGILNAFKGKGKGKRPTPPPPPVDARGFPTKEQPATMEQAARAFGGRVIRPRNPYVPN